MFKSERQESLDKLKTNSDLTYLVNCNIKYPETFTQLVSDASVINKLQKRQAEILDTIALHIREYMYKINQKRIAKLKQIPQS